MPTAVIDQSDRIKWLQERMKHLGASDIPKILGLTPRWGSPLSVYMEKTADPDFIDDGKPTPYQEMGLALEDWLLAKLAAYYEADDYRKDGTLFVSDEREHLSCTRDGVILWDWKEDHFDREKSAELKSWAFDDWGGEVPPHIFCQVQTQCYVMDEPEIPLGIVFRVSGETHFKTIQRDEDYIGGTILPAADKFWRAVQDRDPSELEVDGSDATLQALAAMNPQDKGKEIVLDHEFEAKADELVAIREEMKVLKDRKDEIRNELAAAGKDATMLVLPDCRYFNYKEVNVKAREAKAYSFRTPTGPFGGQK